MKLLIAGDLSLQDRAKKAWGADDLQNAFSGIKGIVEKCEHAIVNLESPVTDNNSTIMKDGPILKNDNSVFDVIKYCGFDIVTLANNHLKDYECQGVVDTIDKCRKHGLAIVGAGNNLAESRKPFIIDNNNEGLTVGVLNVCEHESSIATSTNAGAAPLDFPNLYEDVIKLKGEVDKIIVIIHGGREHYQLPTPRMKREYRMIADFGADIIVNHHQHCYSGYEIYKGKPIFYGLGNFFFDNPNKRNDKWNDGILLQLSINKDSINFALYPFEQCNKEPVIEVKTYDYIKSQIEELNEIIADNNRLVQSFNSLASSVKILFPFLPFGNKYFRFLYFKNLMPACISKKNQALIENALSCETHRELLMCYFEQLLHRK